MRETVFVVEDDDELRYALGELLSVEGHHVVCLANGRQAIDLLRVSAETPSLIITDLTMPVMDGVQLVRAVRGDARYRSIPIIVLTGKNDTMVPVQLDTPVVYKPDFESLLRMIPAAVGSA